MKEKILQALKTKLQNKGFSAKTLEGLAEELAKTVTDEANIDTSIDALEPYFGLFQTELDRRVNAEKKEKKVAGGLPDTKKEEPESDETIPVWAKKLLEQNKSLENEVVKLKTGKEIDSRRQALEKKLEKAPEEIKGNILRNFSKMSFENEDDFTQFLTETETDLAGIQQKLVNQNLSIPPYQGGTQNVNKKSILDDIDKWAESKKAINEKNNTK